MVSIIIAVYNGERYLEQTINSAINQSVDNEIIIVDDSSTDNSKRIVEQYLTKNRNIVFIKNETNIGFCKSVNKAIGLARGSYVLILGQDDLLNPNHCEEMIKHFDNSVSLVFCDYELIGENNKIIDSSSHCYPHDRFIKDLYKYNTIPSVGLMINRKKLNEIGGYPENDRFPQYGEYHTWIRLGLVGRMVYCGTTKSKYRRHKNNMTNNFSDKRTKAKLREYYYTCKKQLLESDKISIKHKMYILLYIFYQRIKSV